MYNLLILLIFLILPFIIVGEVLLNSHINSIFFFSNIIWYIFPHKLYLIINKFNFCYDNDFNLLGIFYSIKNCHISD